MSYSMLDLGNLGSVAASANAFDAEQYLNTTKVVVISGTFVGTVNVEISVDGTNYAIFGSALTIPGTVKVDVPCRKIRTRCTAYTSGTILSQCGGAV